MRGGLLQFEPLPLPPLAVELPDGAATAFVRPGDIIARSGAGPGRVLAVRDAAAERPRIVVRVAGLALDATADAPLPRGSSCRVELRRATVFVGDLMRAEALPLAAGAVAGLV